jgi:hypothetical protein
VTAAHCPIRGILVREKKVSLRFLVSGIVILI